MNIVAASFGAVGTAWQLDVVWEVLKPRQQRRLLADLRSIFQASPNSLNFFR